MKFEKFTASGSVTISFKGPPFCYGFALGTDSVNDPTVTIYNGTDNTGGEAIPTATYDASALGLNGAFPSEGIECADGIYVEITCAGTVEVTVYYGPEKP